MKKVLLHIVGEPPVIAEVEGDIDPGSAFLQVTNVRQRDGKDVPSIDPQAKWVLYPWSRLTFVEILPGDDEGSDVIGLFR